MLEFHRLAGFEPLESCLWFWCEVYDRFVEESGFRVSYWRWQRSLCDTEDPTQSHSSE